MIIEDGPFVKAMHSTSISPSNSNQGAGMFPTRRNINGPMIQYNEEHNQALYDNQQQDDMYQGR